MIGHIVVVTTAHGGVFYGMLTALEANVATLTQARNCLYWSRSVKGFLGLAAEGPKKDCRVGPEVEELVLYDVTSITRCTPSAIEKWKAAPWSG